MYAMDVSGMCDASSPPLSFMNVENVVNPPQNPVVSNRRADGDSQLCVAGIADRVPIKRQPTIFTVKVPTGNGDDIIAVMPFDIKKRNPPPIPEPRNTNRNSFICFVYYDKVSILSPICRLSCKDTNFIGIMFSLFAISGNVVP